MNFNLLKKGTARKSDQKMLKKIQRCLFGTQPSRVNLWKRAGGGSGILTGTAGSVGGESASSGGKRGLTKNLK